MLGDNQLLFPPHRERAAFEHQLGIKLSKALQEVAEGPVSPIHDFESYLADLENFTFETPMDMTALADWSISRLKTGLVQISHPRYLGLFNPAASFPSQCADRIVAAFNPQLASATTSPAAVAIEAHVIRAIAKRAGMKSQSGWQIGGHFTSGGSEANATATICALTNMAPEFASIGSRGFAGEPVFYISQDSHLAWLKIAHQTGIGRSAARMVPTDGAGRMHIAELGKAIRQDRESGKVPFMIVATAGTTNAGMVDPLEQCEEIARREGIWYHVDAAWGGGVIASDQYLHCLQGIEKADSVTIDAHKWFATTMGCGMILVTKPEILTEAFNVAASFMPAKNEGIDPYVTSMQWSRRFTGLRLFLSLAAAGWGGHASHVERSFFLITKLVQMLEGRGWSRVNGPDALAVACLSPPRGSKTVRSIVDDVLKSGIAWLSVASFEGGDVIRACVTHGETSPDDIEQIVGILEKSRSI